MWTFEVIPGGGIVVNIRTNGGVARMQAACIMFGPTDACIARATRIYGPYGTPR